MIGVIAVLILGGGFAYSKLAHKASTGTNAKNNIDLSPATPAEKQDSNEHKENTSQNNQPTPPPSSTSSVTPVIVDASQYSDKIEVRSYVPGVFENGGTCTVTLTKGSLQVTKQAAATEDATTTRCANVSIDRSEFSEAGQWTATVSYSSTAYQGSSKPTTVEVQ